MGLDLIRTAGSLLSISRRSRSSAYGRPTGSRSSLKRVLHTRELLPKSQQGKPVLPDWDFESAVDNGLKVEAILYSALRSRANAIGSVPWTADVKEDKGEWSPRDDHPIIELLSQPNDHTSGQEMHERLSYHMDLGGNSLRVKSILGRTEPGALLPAVGAIFSLVPHNIFPVPVANTSMLSGYKFDGGFNAKKKTWKTGQIIHDMFPDPENALWGLSPVKPMSRTVDTMVQGTEWNMTSLQERAIADGVFLSDEPMSPEEYQDYKEQIRQQHQGPKNAHAPWVVGGGFKFQEMSRTPVEMDFIKSMLYYREVILSAADVPPVFAGFFDEATLANANVSIKLFWVNKMVPFLSRQSGVYRRSLVPHFGDPKKLRVRPDLSKVEPLREDRGAQSEVFEKLVQNGVPYNEAIVVSNLPLKTRPGDGDEPFGVSDPVVKLAVKQIKGEIERKILDLGGGV